MKQPSTGKHRIVVKVGSNVLTTDEGKLDITRMSALVDQIAFLRRKNIDIILVSSGAVACGRKELKVDHSLDSVEQRQLFSAMGQVKLVNLYYDLFREYGIHIGQVLTTKDNFTTQRTYDNQRACMEVMLENGVIPIVNENDTVSIEELMFTDNDELSGLIAQMMRVDLLILLTNVNGIYTGNPNDASSHIINKVYLHDDISQYIQEGKSMAGRGGMESKYKTARKTAEAGIRVIIANGNRDNILTDLVMQPDSTEHTEFVL
jgi:glutamate 5-kinase